MMNPRSTRFSFGGRTRFAWAAAAILGLTLAYPLAAAGEECVTSRQMYYRTGANCPQGVQTCDFALGVTKYTLPSGAQVLLMGTGYDMHVFPFSSLSTVGPGYQSRALGFVSEGRASIERVTKTPSVDPFTGIGALAYEGEHPGRVFQVSSGGTASLVWRDFDGAVTSSKYSAAFSLPGATGRVPFVAMEAKGESGSPHSFRVLRVDGNNAFPVHDFGFVFNSLSDMVGGYYGDNGTYFLLVLRSRELFVFRMTLNSGGSLVVTSEGNILPHSFETTPHISAFTVDPVEGRLYLSAMRHMQSAQGTNLEVWNLLTPAQPAYLGRMHFPGTSLIVPRAAGGNGVVLFSNTQTGYGGLASFANPANPVEIPTPDNFPNPDPGFTGPGATLDAVYVEDSQGNVGFITTNIQFAAAVTLNPACLNVPGVANLSVARTAGHGDATCQPPTGYTPSVRGFPGDTFTLTNQSGDEPVQHLKIRGVAGTSYPEQTLASGPWTSRTWGADVNVPGLFEVEYKLVDGEAAFWYIQLCPDPASQVAVTAVNDQPCSTCAWLQGDTLTVTAQRAGNPDGYIFVFKDPEDEVTGQTGTVGSPTAQLPLQDTGDYRAGLVAHYTFAAANAPGCSDPLFSDFLVQGVYNSCRLVTPDPIPSGPGSASFEVWQSGVKKAGPGQPGTIMVGQSATLKFTGKVQNGWAPSFNYSNLPGGVTISCPYPGSHPYTGFQCTTSEIPQSAARDWQLLLDLCQDGTPGQGCSDPWRTNAPSVTVTAASTVTLTIARSGSGSGSVSGSPGGLSCSGPYPLTCHWTVDAGTQLTLSASANQGSTFAGWSGGGCSGTGNCTIVVNQDTTVTATFNAQAQYTLSVTKMGAGSGTVTSNPAGINCGSTCSASFSSGASVTLSANPASGSTFGGWGGACAGSTGSTCTVSMTQSRSVSATFNTSSPGTDRTLTVTRSGTGSGYVTSQPAGVTCTHLGCSGSFPNGTSVTLNAHPNAGSVFGGWSGEGCSGTGGCTVTMNANRTVNAAFETSGELVTVTVVKQGSGIGTVTSNPSGINCGTTCSTHSAQFASGAPVSLSATAGHNSVFGGWSGGGCSGTGSCSITPTTDTTITARFDPELPSGSFDILAATQIGQQITFAIPHVPDSVQAVKWNFGGPACPGDAISNEVELVCYYDDCSSVNYRYGTPGTKTVKLYFFTSSGGWTKVGEETHQVGTTGSCSLWSERPAAVMIPDLAARIPGLAFWESSLYLYNPGDRYLYVDLYARTPNNRRATVNNYRIPPQGSRDFDHVLNAILADNPAIEGRMFALWMQPSEPDGPLPVIGATTFTRKDGGTYGQALPLLPILPAAEVASTQWLTGGIHNGTEWGFRTNLTIINPHDRGWGSNRGITLTLYPEEGDPVVAEVKAAAEFQVWRFSPITNVFDLPEGTDLGVFSLKVEVPAGISAVVGASVNDNITDDSYLLLAEPML